MKKITILLGLIITGCTLGAPPPAPPVEATAPSAFQYEVVCEDEEGSAVTCSYDSDCCEGFVCVKDPQGGRADKFCAQDK